MVMSSWCGFAALGSGLILCAVAAGTDPPVAVPLVALAVVELFWGGIALRTGRVPAPRAMLAVAACVAAVATALLFVGLVGIVPVLALLVLHWTAAVLAVLALRRGGDTRRDAGTGREAELPLDRRREGRPRGARVRAWRTRPAALVLTLTAQAMLVAAITTPALAHTAPGESAVPHGSMQGTHGH